LDKGKPDSDESTAREAVMEGQATWLTWAYEAKLAGGKAEAPEDALNGTDADAPDDGSFPVLNALRCTCVNRCYSHTIRELASRTPFFIVRDEGL